MANTITKDGFLFPGRYFARSKTFFFFWGGGGGRGGTPEREARAWTEPLTRKY